MAAEVSSSQPAAPGQELPIEGKTVRALALLAVKRTFDMFAGNHGQKVPLDENGCAPLMLEPPAQ